MDEDQYAATRRWREQHGAVPGMAAPSEEERQHTQRTPPDGRTYALIVGVLVVILVAIMLMQGGMTRNGNGDGDSHGVYERSYDPNP